MQGTLWAAYNGVTDLVDHSGGRLIGPRAARNGRTIRAGAAAFGSAYAPRLLESAWFGTGARIKARAWEEAMKLVAAS